MDDDNAKSPAMIPSSLQRRGLQGSIGDSLFDLGVFLFELCCGADTAVVQRSKISFPPSCLHLPCTVADVSQVHADCIMERVAPCAIDPNRTVRHVHKQGLSIRLKMGQGPCYAYHLETWAKFSWTSQNPRC